LPHWVAGGLVVPLFDRASGCVRRGTVYGTSVGALYD
jgi:hypothetical protein